MSILSRDNCFDGNHEDSGMEWRKYFASPTQKEGEKRLKIETQLRCSERRSFKRLLLAKYLVACEVTRMMS